MNHTRWLDPAELTGTVRAGCPHPSVAPRITPSFLAWVANQTRAAKTRVDPQSLVVSSPKMVVTREKMHYRLYKNEHEQLRIEENSFCPEVFLTILKHLSRI